VNGQVTMKNNFIFNPDIGYEIIVVHSTPDVIATDNWWGTTDESEIEAKILDNSDRTPCYRGNHYCYNFY
jgi:hypothetical protein